MSKLKNPQMYAFNFPHQLFFTLILSVLNQVTQGGTFVHLMDVEHKMVFGLGLHQNRFNWCSKKAKQ